MNTISWTGILICCIAFSSTAETGKVHQALRASTQTVVYLESLSAKDRFEGYQWLDADGVPLPFQSDAEIEGFLSSANAVSKKNIPTGVTKPKKVLLAGKDTTMHAIFKRVDETKRNAVVRSAGKPAVYHQWRDSHTYDVAAYRLDRLLGLDRMPVSVIRRLKSKSGALTIWLENTITTTEKRDRELTPPDLDRWNQQTAIMRIFDNLAANRDSHLGNTLIDRNWRLWFIDCSRCFGDSETLLFPEAITRCERNLWFALQNLDEFSVRDRLGPLLTSDEIEALLVRRDKIADHIQELIDRWGETQIIFDLRPPTVTAPWGKPDPGRVQIARNSE